MKRKPKAPRPGPAFEPCANCDNGWVTIRPQAVSGDWVRGGAAVIRCSCWHAHQAKVEELEAKDRQMSRKGAES